MISIHSITESEFTSCRKSSLGVGKSENKTERNSIIKEECFTTKKIFLKIKNIPYSAKENTICNYFKNYNVAENSIRCLRSKKGYFEGEAIIAFSSEEEVEKVFKEKNGELLYTQNLRLEYSNLGEYHEFAFSEAFNYTSKHLAEIVIPQEVTLTLFVCNFPLDYPKESILSLFEIFNLVKFFFILIFY